ncbi:YceI family protein [Clavibacter michiganensis]|uniref:YceI family protein n=1 Tax=Clavibacter michiganensis TaxID=28447 RepID=UPI000B8E9145|nr:YceI family protein [Clavibacter michiganensis]OQJ58466.1 hypothetical protein B5P21_00010 [Clavibacter michiganensis subsp. insidiosus]
MQKKTKIILGTSAAVVVVLVSAPPRSAPRSTATRSSAPLRPPRPSRPTPPTPRSTRATCREWQIGTGSTAGYRVAEVLNGTDVTVVGKTEDVTGDVTVDGSTLTAATVKVDVASIATDAAPRDEYFRGTAMEVSEYPDATFTLHAAGRRGRARERPGRDGRRDRRAHDARRDADRTVPLQAALSGDGVQISGSIPVTFSDYASRPRPRLRERPGQGHRRVPGEGDADEVGVRPTEGRRSASGSLLLPPS